MKQRIAHFITENNLLTPQGKCLVALSGGADSVALLLVLSELGYRVEAVHCNFLLRGQESFRDENFCLSLCQQQNIPFHRIHFDTKTYASVHKVSIEMAARTLRYQYFEQLRADVDADAVCVAHHRDDQAETVLLNLVRGTGIHGLTGMKPKNGSVVRPLLCVSKHDILQFLSERNQPFVTDSTNLTADITRNKLRLSVVPLLKDINPSVIEHLTKMAHFLREAEKMADSALPPVRWQNAEKRSEGFEISVSALLSSASPIYVLYHYLKDYGFQSAQVEQIARQLGNMETGKVFLSATHQLLIDRGRLVVVPIKERIKPFRIPEPGTYVVGPSLKIRVQQIERNADFIIEKRADVCLLDAAKVRFPLLLRTVEPGDRFVPLGMKGSKLMSDYLTDRKMSLFDKQNQLLVADATGAIVWVAHQRPSELHKVTDATHLVLRLQVF